MGGRARAYLVQQPLVRVGLHVAKKAKTLYGANQVPRATSEARARDLEHNLTVGLHNTQHVLARDEEQLPVEWKCKACCSHPTTVTGRCEWLATTCTGRPAIIHESHAPNLRKLWGVWYCDACGYWAVRRFIGLRRQCPTLPPTGVAKAALDRLRAQELPVGLPNWPDRP